MDISILNKKILFNNYINMKEGQRSFTLIKMKTRQKIKSKEDGRYISKTVEGAAKKAFMRECRRSKIRGQCTIFITLRETTQGKTKYIYKYKMKRIKLKTPLIIFKNGTKIKIQYKVEGKRIKKELFDENKK